jgi:hypothetical protein
LTPHEEPRKPKTLDDLLLGKMYVRRDTGTIPAKVGISDSGALTVYISQPLFWFWNSYIRTNNDLPNYLAVWIRSIKKLIPKIDSVAKEWTY